MNLKGPFRLAALIGTRMAAGDGGSIINVSSVARSSPRPIELPYAAAKAGLNALTVGLAQRFGPTVRVNAIHARPVPHRHLARPGTWTRSRRPRGRSSRSGAAAEPEEIVGAALYLASDASTYTTGATIKIDGGVAWAGA